MTLVAIDWGTSSLRGALLADDGRVLEERSAPRGILTVPPGGFAVVFEDLFADWMRAASSSCLISGMAGSKQGWIEAPCCACPASLNDVAQQIVELQPGRIALVPGLRDEHDGVPDLMRGEEVPIFGAMALTGLDSGLFVLPGTHTKWARVENGSVTGFRTFMTGEFYALLAQHSMLARTIDASAALDEAAFRQGVARAGNGQGLLHNAFGAHTLSLLDRMSAGERASYLSGLLIGEELRSRSAQRVGEELVLIGAPALTRRYALALQANGIAARTLGLEATWAGLHSLARARQSH